MKKIKRNSKNFIKNNVAKQINDLDYWNIKAEYFLCLGDCEVCFAPHCPCFDEVSKEDIQEYIEARRLIEDYNTNL